MRQKKGEEGDQKTWGAGKCRSSKNFEHADYRPSVSKKVNNIKNKLKLLQFPGGGPPVLFAICGLFARHFLIKYPGTSWA